MNPHITNDKAHSNPLLDAVPRALHAAIETYITSMTEIYLEDNISVDFARTEQKVIAMVMPAGKEALKSIAEKRDDDHRSRYRNRRTRNAICPTAESLGLLEGGVTRLAGKIITHMCAECTPRTVASMLQQMGAMTPSVSTIQRLVGEVHEPYLAIEEEALVKVRSQETIPEEAMRMSVSLDGAIKGAHPIGVDKEVSSCGSN